ncbi:hypothetical protein HOD29_07110 [archaeon]|jgi:hypothetical protein|nr:hypothetical protein [archaeon]
MKKDKTGIGSINDIGGTLNFAEPVNFMLKKDGTYQVSFRDNIYDVDMDKLNELAKH